MGTMRTEYLADANAIVEAVRRIRQDPSIVREARRSLAGALDLLGLRGTARQAVTPLLTAVAGDGSICMLKKESFWF